MDGEYQFECQHGERECAGNIVQACTIFYAPDQDTLVNLITCMMSSSAPDQAGPQCYDQFEVDYQPILVRDGGGGKQDSESKN